jgi:hypothetical protein
VSNLQKFNFETQFKALFLQWTVWVDGRLREMILNAVRQESRITYESDAIMCTSTEDTMTMVRMFLSKYLQSDLGKRYTPTMLEKFGSAFAFYVDQIQLRACSSLEQIENTWGKHMDPIYTAVKNGRTVELREAIKSFKRDGFNLSRWVGATKASTRGGVFHVAAKYHQHDSGLLQLLKDETCHPNSQDSLQRTCLHILAQKLAHPKRGENNAETEREHVKFLTELFKIFPDVNVNIVDHTSQTPLQILAGSKSDSEFVIDARRMIEMRSNGEEQTLFSPVLSVDFCAHVNSINYILNNAPDLMQDHAQNEDDDDVELSSENDIIYNALRKLRKHCRHNCSAVLKRAFQVLCSTVITPVLKHVIGIVKVDPEASSDIDKAKAGIAAGIKAIKKVVPGSKPDDASEHSQPKYFDRNVVQRDSSYMIKAIQEQLMGPIMCFITQGDKSSQNDRIKHKRLKFVRDVVLPEFWNCILDTVESFLLPILADDTHNELSIYDAKLLQKLVFELLPQVFALYDAQTDVALGLDDSYFKRHSGTSRLKILFALYCVPVRRLCDMHEKLLLDEGVRRAWNIQPVDVLRIIRSWRNKFDLAKEYLKKSGSQNEDWELCLRFKTPDTERRIASFADVEEISGGFQTQKGTLYLMTSFLVCEWSRNITTTVKEMIKIRLTDLRHFEHDPPSSGSLEKLHIHYISDSKLVELKLRVKSAAEIIVPTRQAAVLLGNRRVKEFIGTVDDRNSLKSKFDIPSDEVLMQQHSSCVLSDAADRDQKSGTVYVFNRRIIFEENSLLTKTFKLAFLFEKTTFKQSHSNRTFSMKCRRDTGELYRLSFKDLRTCAAVCKHCDDATVMISKEKMQFSNLVKLWLPADEGSGGQSSKTFKVQSDDTIKCLVQQLRSKMAITEEETLDVAIEGPIPFRPDPEEMVNVDSHDSLFSFLAFSHWNFFIGISHWNFLIGIHVFQVVNVQNDLKELGVSDQSKWIIISDKSHRLVSHFPRFPFHSLCPTPASASTQCCSPSSRTVPPLLPSIPPASSSNLGYRSS